MALTDMQLIYIMYFFSSVVMVLPLNALYAYLAENGVLIQYL